MVEPGVVSIVVSEMALALDFYRLLGLDIPEGAGEEPHVEVQAAGGCGWPGIPGN